VSLFHVLCSRTRFWRCRVRRVPFSCSVLPVSISAVPRAYAPFFMFCAPRLVFGGTGGVGSNFLILRALTHFQRYRGRPFSFSCFPLPDMFSAVPRASCPIFIFCAPRLVFDNNQGRRVSFLRFGLPDSFSAIPRASDPDFIFCAPVLVFGGTEGVVSLFHVFRSWTYFWRYRGHRVQFSCFALPDSFSVVPSASAPVFMFCVPGLIFNGTVVVGSHFLVLRAQTSIRQFRGLRVPF
jgi:hypothetical protein